MFAGAQNEKQTTLYIATISNDRWADNNIFWDNIYIKHLTKRSGVCIITSGEKMADKKTDSIAITKCKQYMEKMNIGIKEWAIELDMEMCTLSRWINGVGGNKRYPNPQNRIKINKCLARANMEIIDEWIEEA